jgi:hypothetical protein
MITPEIINSEKETVDAIDHMPEAGQRRGLALHRNIVWQQERTSKLMTINARRLREKDWDLLFRRRSYRRSIG